MSDKPATAKIIPFVPPARAARPDNRIIISGKDGAIDCDWLDAVLDAVFDLQEQARIRHIIMKARQMPVEPAVVPFKRASFRKNEGPG